MPRITQPPHLSPISSFLSPFVPLRVVSPSFNVCARLSMHTHRDGWMNEWMDAPVPLCSIVACAVACVSRCIVCVCVCVGASLHMHMQRVSDDQELNRSSLQKNTSGCGLLVTSIVGVLACRIFLHPTGDGRTGSSWHPSGSFEATHTHTRNPRWCSHW